jgi:hypothetical protein
LLCFKVGIARVANLCFIPQGHMNS